MSIFKRSKAKAFAESLKKENFIVIPPDDTFPEVIKESKIKPTKCAGCRSIYQAKHKHLKMGFDKGKKITECPLCHTENAVEFEEDAEKETKIMLGGSPCSQLSLRKKDRAAMRGKPLDEDCKTAHTTTHEYGANDYRVFCYGLEDAKSDELLDKCRNCPAHWSNAEPPQEDEK